MDWSIFAIVGLLSTLVNLFLGEGVFCLVWLVLLYASLNTGGAVDWYYLYLPYVTFLGAKKGYSQLHKIMGK